MLGLLLAGAEVLESDAVQQLGEAHIEGFEQVARNVEVEIPYCVGASSEYQSGQPLSRLVVWPAHNARFVTPAKEPASAFVPFAGDLDDIPCVQEERVVAGDNTVRYKGMSLQIPADRHRHHYVKARVRVHHYPDGHLAVFHHGPRCLVCYDADGDRIDNDDKQQAA